MGQTEPSCSLKFAQWGSCCLIIKISLQFSFILFLYATAHLAVCLSARHSLRHRQVCVPCQSCVSQNCCIFESCLSHLLTSESCLMFPMTTRKKYTDGLVLTQPQWGQRFWWWWKTPSVGRCVGWVLLLHIGIPEWNFNWVSGFQGWLLALLNTERNLSHLCIGILTAGSSTLV